MGMGISVVVPIYNEAEVLTLFYERTVKVLEQLGMPYELLFVDDGSVDNSLERLNEFNKSNPSIKFISFSRNFGHQAAVSAGLRYASGDCVVVIDGDLQDPPEFIAEMVKKWREGFDVVYGIRRHRKEGLLKRFCYKVFYHILRKVSLVNIPLDAGDFSLMSRRVVMQIRRLNEDNPFVRGLRAWVGFKQIGLEYERLSREAGAPKYTIIKLFKLAFDGILSFTLVPLEAIIFIGFTVSFFSILYAIYIGINRILVIFNIIAADNIVPGFASLVCSIMFLMGLQFIFLGILGEYIGRIFTQVKGRPIYIIDEAIGLPDAK